MARRRKPVQQKQFRLPHFSRFPVKQIQAIDFCRFEVNVIHIIFPFSPQRQVLNLNDPIKVLQPNTEVAVDFKYWDVYQKVQSSDGSTAKLV